MRALVALALLGVLVGVTGLAGAEPSTGAARPHAIDRSGIQAQILFLDTGSPDKGLVVSGFATGLDPGAAYFSLIYDVGSVPGGPAACTPSGPALSGAQMGVGFWEVAPDGTGSLFAVKTGASYAPLDAVGAVSVRIVLGPPPAGFVLQACGQIHRNP